MYKYWKKKWSGEYNFYHAAPFIPYTVKNSKICSLEALNLQTKNS